MSVSSQTKQLCKRNVAWRHRSLLYYIFIAFTLLFSNILRYYYYYGIWDLQTYGWFSIQRFMIFGRVIHKYLPFSNCDYHVTITRKDEVRSFFRLIYFMLYSNAAIGCEDPTPSPNSVTLRNGDLLTVKCNFSMDIYQRRCKNDRWTGDVANCSYGNGVRSLYFIAIFYLCTHVSIRETR